MKEGEMDNLSIGGGFRSRTLNTVERAKLNQREYGTYSLDQRKY
jgi:hypothetical protein